MSEPIKDGGPAFPEAIAIGPAGDVYPGMGGMTLRDYFAGQALIGLCLNDKQYGWAPEGVAARAYTLSDAMIAAREAKP